MNALYRLYFAIEKRTASERVKRVKLRMKFCGDNVYIDPSCHIVGNEGMEVGDNTSISSYTTIYATFGVKIGKNCLISSNCGISSYNHIQNSPNRRKDESQDHKFSKPVIIGNNVWIGMNVCILPGVIIGDNSIVGSGSVVTKSVPANEIWVGNPARIVRKLNVNTTENMFVNDDRSSYTYVQSQRFTD